MSHPRQQKRQKRVREELIEVEENENGTANAIFIPCSNDSGSSDSSESDTESDDFSNGINFPKMSYRQVRDSYEENQTKLAPNHGYEWIIGERQYHEIPKNNILLSDKTKKFLKTLSSVQLFELFFSSDLKEYIIKCTNSNGYQLTANELDIFLGIIIMTIFNNRKSERDYWSTNELLRCNLIASAMSRDKFLKIKRNIKFNKSQDKNEHDKVWRVRNIVNIFRKNISQFGFFSTALSIDEMMVKFHGRAPVLQFMPNKPERFGIKIWAICSPQGYLFDLDVYCGKGSNIYSSDNKMN